VYGDTQPNAAYFYLSRSLAEIFSVYSDCGLQRNMAGNASGSNNPYALLLVRVRTSSGTRIGQKECYAGSSVEAFVEDMRRRGLHVDMLEIPPSVLEYTADEHHAHL
jgi:hypothetical protein